MNRTLQRGKVALALLVIFTSGIGLGWFGHQARTIPGESQPPAAANTPVAAGIWTDRAMATLSRELQLTGAQQQEIRPLLQEAAGKMDLDRERALFQLHLQVLKVHDEMRPHLQPGQVPALERMRVRLQQDIKRRFAAILNDPSQPTPDL
jgi:hypothetical protein